jgi:hypothetical protein
MCYKSNLPIELLNIIGDYAGCDKHYLKFMYNHTLGVINVIHVKLRKDKSFVRIFGDSHAGNWMPYVRYPIRQRENLFMALYNYEKTVRGEEQKIVSRMMLAAADIWQQPVDWYLWGDYGDLCKIEKVRSNN